MDWPADSVERWDLERLKPYADNSRTHSREQIEQIARSFDQFGWTIPVLCDEEGEIIAGHGRVLAAALRKIKTVPVMVARGWTEAQKRAYRIADNKLTLNADWDDAVLRAELVALKSMDFQMDLIGFSVSELKTLTGEAGGGGAEEEAPTVGREAVSRLGDVWVLGPHRVLCGDACSSDNIAALVPIGESIQLLHADPPYGMGKEAQGVQNDNLYGAKLDEFQLRWWRAARPRLDANASAYVWGNATDLWRLWYRGVPKEQGGGGLGDLEPVTLRNEIVWDKGSIAGMKSADLTQYPEASERCLFFQLGRHVFLINQTKDDYWPGWEPLRTWMVEQRDAAGFSSQDVKRICGNHMYGHWFGQSQWSFISRENYEKLTEAAAGRAFSRPYDELLVQYRQLAQLFNGEVRGPRESEYLSGRPYFDNAHDIMRDVWTFPRVKGEDRAGHATPKPLAMIERIIRSSLREGDLVLEPFLGTGTTLIAAHKTGRRCYGLELDPLYVDVTIRRWQSMTGKFAVLEQQEGRGPARCGDTFERVERARQETEAQLSKGT